MMTDSESSPCFGDRKFFAPGFRFYPMDEELILYYLKKKICGKRLWPDIIAEIDVYKWDPEDLPGQSKLKTGDRQWFFFSPRDRKYANGARSSRATTNGYWKATGKDRIIEYNSRSVGVKKTLVFYKGRAPAGKRTDWVMHEYGLNEEELKRCHSVRDCYVLYKVFKKSGPGPKNGEQYGAHFEEEEWDDECLDTNGFIGKENSVEQPNEVVSVDNAIANIQPQLPIDDFEEFMNRLAEDPVLVPSCDLGYTLLELVGEQEDQNTLLDCSSREVDLHCQSLELPLPPISQENNAPYSSDLPELATPQSQLYEAPEVVPVPSSHAQEPLAAKHWVDDFLEMEDLLGSEPTNANNDYPLENLQFDEMNGLSEYELFHYASVFPFGMGPGEPVEMSHLSKIGNDNVNSQLQPQTDDSIHVHPQRWLSEERYTVFTPAESIQGTVLPPISGVVCDGNFANLPVGAHQNQSSKQDEGTDSLSSSLWAVLESIPTSPALAAESALVNKAFVQVSSFDRLRFSAVNTSIGAGNSTSITRCSGISNNSIILYFLVLGIVCAISWVFVTPNSHWKMLYRHEYV